MSTDRRYLDRGDQLVRRLLKRPFLAAALVLFPGYVIALGLGSSASLPVVFALAARNLILLLPLALLSRSVIAHRIIGLRPTYCLIAHSGLAVAFTLTWYLALLVAIAARSGWQSDGFTVSPFEVDAGAWQLFQGITLYALVATGTHLAELVREREASENLDRKTQTPSSNLLIQTDQGAISVSVPEIIKISGDGDYTQIQTLGRSTLKSRTRLAGYEAILSSETFIKAHRSHLINCEHINEVEPAGNGRLTLHLSGGISVVTSRSGAKLIKTRFC